jgi:DNA repair protein RadD
MLARNANGGDGTLRDYQLAAMDQLRAAAREGSRRIMLQAPTGSGKTRIASSVVQGARNKNNRILFVVPRISLVDQTISMFYNQGITEVGAIQAFHELTDWRQPVQVASIQTLQRRKLPDASVVIIDEAHIWYKFYSKWFLDATWQKIPFIGLSATPWTRGLGSYYDKLIVAATTRELIDRGDLSPFRVYAPSRPDLKNVRTVAGDYHEGDLSTVMDTQPLVADVVDTWLRLGESRSTLCFAVDRPHAKHLQQKFETAGVTCGYIDAFTKMGERDEIRRKFHNGDLRVVMSIGCLTIGIDWDVRALILARPTKSEMLFVQIIGRALRTAEGKDYALILDHTGTHEKLGFVTDIHHEALSNGREPISRKSDKIPLPKLCPHCQYLKPPRVPKCPACGFFAQAVPTEHANGELTELKPPKATMPDKRSFYAQMLYIAKERGYKEGWAANKYREKFEVWPNGMKDVGIEHPTAATRSWVLSRQIAWAKSNQRTGEHAR